MPPPSRQHPGALYGWTARHCCCLRANVVPYGVNPCGWRPEQGVLACHCALVVLNLRDSVLHSVLVYRDSTSTCPQRPPIHFFCARDALLHVPAHTLNKIGRDFAYLHTNISDWECHRQNHLISELYQSKKRWEVKQIRWGRCHFWIWVTRKRQFERS